MKKAANTHEKVTLETSAVRNHFDGIARDYDYWKGKNSYYYEGLKRLFGSIIPAGGKVLEVGCGTGEILHAVRPREGLGIDLSSDMVRIARAKLPDLSFEVVNIETAHFETTYDHVIMADLMDHLPDIWKALYGLETASHGGTTLVISTINPLWDPLLLLGEKLRMKMPEGPHNFVPVADLAGLLTLFDYEIQEVGYRMPCPVYLPILSALVNRWIPRIPVLRRLGVMQYLVARKKKVGGLSKQTTPFLSVSVVVPCHNEIENIERCIRRIPQMGSHTEILVVDDGSTDGTAEKVRSLRAEIPNLRVESWPGRRGKGPAVRQGFDMASGQFLMILDADMAIEPEDLPKFFWALQKEAVGFVNGTRMVYPMEEESMRTLNLIGNKIFSLIFTWLLGHRITDTLCGTKAIRKSDYARLKVLPQFGSDPWGDFDLLFGASELGLKIVEMPIPYKARRYGLSKMRAFKHGLILLYMCLNGFIRLKLRPRPSFRDGSISEKNV